MPFWPVWLRAQGMGPEQIGILLSAIFWIKVVTDPLIAGIADRLGERRRPIIILSLGCLASYTLIALADGFWPLLGVSLLAGMFFAAMFPLGENLTLMMSDGRALDYGRIRLWGSISFIAAAVAGGWVLEGRSEDLVLWLILGALGVTVAVSCLLPDERLPRARRPAAPSLRLLRRRIFLVFLIATGLLQSSHAVYYGFSTLHWRAAGLSDEIIGWLWAEAVFAEVILFSFSGPLVRRLGPVTLMLLAGAAGLLRWSLTAASTDLSVLLAVQVLHAFTFGAAHLGAMHFLTRAAPLEISATAQSLYSAIGMGIVFGLAMLAAGALYGTLGGAAFHVMAGLSLAGALVTLVLARWWSGDRLKL